MMVESRRNISNGEDNGISGSLNNTVEMLLQYLRLPKLLLIRFVVIHLGLAS
jgi:hypothetical protein